MYFLHINKIVIYPSLSDVYEESELIESVTQKMKSSKQKHVIEINLTKIDGDGDFLCPKCRIAISPDDETENVYTIIEEKIRNDNFEELIIQCNTCETKISLTGFPALDVNISSSE